MEEVKDADLVELKWFTIKFMNYTTKEIEYDRKHIYYSKVMPSDETIEEKNISKIFNLDENIDKGDPINEKVAKPKPCKVIKVR